MELSHFELEHYQHGQNRNIAEEEKDPDCDFHTHRTQILPVDK